MNIVIDIDDNIINNIKKYYPNRDYLTNIKYIIYELNKAFDPKYDNGAKIINKVADSIIGICEGSDLNEYKVAELINGCYYHYDYNTSTYRDLSIAIECLNRAKFNEPNHNYVILQRTATNWVIYDGSKICNNLNKFNKEN